MSGASGTWGAGAHSRTRPARWRLARSPLTRSTAPRHATWTDGSAPQAPLRCRTGWTSYGEVRGLAYGGYGEASSDVHTLIEASASHLARTTWRWSGARSAEELRNALITRYRRRVGIRVVKAFAAYRLERVPYIGMPRHIVESIRRDQRPEPPTIDIPLVVYTAQRDIDAQREMREGGPRGG